MYYYLFINILLTLLVAITLVLLRTSPFRVRFKVTLIAICSWLVPYDLIHSIVSQYQVIQIPISLAQYGDSIRQVIAPQLTSTDTLFSLSLMITALCIIGLFVFINDLLSLKNKLKNQQKISTLHKNVNGTNCYCVTGINAAFSSGLFKPVIWFDEKYLNHKNLNSLLEHELQHIKQLDHLWLLLITFVQRLLWWNPLVYILCQKSRALIELSCDQACANSIGNSNYQKHLANLMIEQNTPNIPNTPVLVNNFFGKNKFNIFRIKKLSEEFIMNRKHKSTLLLTFLIMSMILLVSMQSVSMQAKEDIALEDVILTENQIIVVTKVTLYTNYKPVKHVDDSSESTTKFVAYNKKSYEAKMVVDLGKPFKFSATELEDFEFEATATKTNDNNVFVQTDIKFISAGKNIHLQPTMIVPPPPEFGKIIITDDDGDYKLEMDFTIHK